MGHCFAWRQLTELGTEGSIEISVVRCLRLIKLTVVSHVAEQSRTHNTTMCYIHERTILIERSPKAYCKKLPYEKTTHAIKTTYNHQVYRTDTK